MKEFWEISCWKGQGILFIVCQLEIKDFYKSGIATSHCEVANKNITSIRGN